MVYWYDLWMIYWYTNFIIIEMTIFQAILYSQTKSR